MKLTDSRLDPADVAKTRALLKSPERRERLGPALLAATALALISVLFAAVAVVAPPLTTEHVAQGAPG